MEELMTDQAVRRPGKHVLGSYARIVACNHIWTHSLSAFLKTPSMFPWSVLDVLVVDPNCASFAIIASLLIIAILAANEFHYRHCFFVDR